MRKENEILAALCVNIDDIIHYHAPPATRFVFEAIALLFIVFFAMPVVYAFSLGKRMGWNK